MSDKVGQQLGNYRLVNLLGQGGFADVYLGEHIYLGTKAAIKVLQARLSEQDDIKGFREEAQMIAHLSHPHIIRILDFGIDGETPFLVMDYAANGTLRQRHPRGMRVPLPEVITYVKQVAEALQYAHDDKLIHRDVKPENMLIGRHDTILLSDFGIALVAQSSRYQSTQDVIGTVSYMAPEQIQGKPRVVSDQYSLGIVVYEWLSGERPFRGSFTELCTQHMFAPPPPLHTRMPDITPEVERVILTALAKDPKQRFGNIRAFANALEQAAQATSQPVDSATSKAATSPVVSRVITVTPPKISPQYPPVPPPVSSQQPSAQAQQGTLTPPPPPTSTGTTATGGRTPNLLTPSTPQSVQGLAASSGQQPSYPGQQPYPVQSVPPAPYPMGQYPYPQQGLQGQYAPQAPYPYPSYPPNPGYVWPAPPQATKKRNIWQLGLQQLLAMLVGSAIYAAFNYTVTKITDPNFFNNIGGNAYLPTGFTIFFAVALSFVLFFGAKFGPLVGLVCAIAGDFLGNVILGGSPGPLTTLPLYYYIADGLAGFLMGFSLAGMEKRSSTGSELGIISVMCIVSVAISGVITGFGDFNAYPRTISFVSFFVPIIWNIVISLIVLFILVPIYNAIARRKS